MSSFFHIMPVDKSTICTRILVHPDLRANPKAYIKANHYNIRTMKPTKGMSAAGPTWNLTLDILTYKGIKVKLTQLTGEQLTNATIQFNPGVCLYGDNGAVISLREFLDALAILGNQLTPLLSNPADCVDLIPGLRISGPAFWSYLEVPFHCPDPGDALFARLRHLRHPHITSSTRLWPTSIQAGPKSGKLRLAIYQKGREMVEHGKLPEEELHSHKDVLRLEARMREEKLVLYFGNERNIEIIDGVERLVRFYPRDLVRGHRACFSELQGVFSSAIPSQSSPKPQREPLGKLLARAALDPRASYTFPALMSQLQYYTGSKSKSELATIGEIRDAGMAELSRLSPTSATDLFPDAAYAAQRAVVSELQETKIRHEIEDTVTHRLIYKAYQPPGQPFRPVTQWPSYLKP